MELGDWVRCPAGKGWQHENGQASDRERHFNKNAVGRVKAVSGDTVTVWHIGEDEIWDVPANEVKKIDVFATGDKHEHKICNVCHCWLPVDDFAKNQRNKHGIVRRPSCNPCRTDIDKRAPKSKQAKQFKKNKPKKGSYFKCPICRKRSIVGVTAKIVADHDHHTGDIRDYICDSCNTGLGRFKNGQNCLRDALIYLEEREAGLKAANRKK